MLLALAACAAKTEWARSDTSAAQRTKDYQECREKAYWQALDESQSSHPLYPPYTGTGFGWGPPFRTSVEAPSYFSRGPREAEFIDYCMRERGYMLRPITPQAS
jgi:hypothetical protein